MPSCLPKSQLGLRRTAIHAPSCWRKSTWQIYGCSPKPASQSCLIHNQCIYPKLRRPVLLKWLASRTAPIMPVILLAFTICLTSRLVPAGSPPAGQHFQVSGSPTNQNAPSLYLLLDTAYPTSGQHNRFWLKPFLSPEYVPCSFKPATTRSTEPTRRPFITCVAPDTLNSLASFFVLLLNRDWVETDDNVDYTF